MMIDLHQLYADRLLAPNHELVNYTDIAMCRGICTMYDEKRVGEGPTLVHVMGALLVVACKSMEDAAWVARDLAARVDAAEQQKMHEHILLQTGANGEMLGKQLRAVHEP